MARVTVEDCIDKVENRFDLVLLASHRARMISSGSQITIERDNDKNPVVALREIADETVSLEILRNELIRGHQKLLEADEPEEEIVELMAGEAAWSRPVDAAEEDMDDVLTEDGEEEADEPVDGEIDDLAGSLGDDGFA